MIMRPSDSEGNCDWKAVLCPDQVAFIDGGLCADCAVNVGIPQCVFFTTMKMLRALIYNFRKDSMMHCVQWEPSCALRWSTSLRLLIFNARIYPVFLHPRPIITAFDLDLDLDSFLSATAAKARPVRRHRRCTSKTLCCRALLQDTSSSLLEQSLRRIACQRYELQLTLLSSDNMNEPCGHWSNWRPVCMTTLFLRGKH